MRYQSVADISLIYQADTVVVCSLQQQQKTAELYRYRQHSFGAWPQRIAVRTVSHRSDTQTHKLTRHSATHPDFPSDRTALRHSGPSRPRLPSRPPHSAHCVVVKRAQPVWGGRHRAVWYQIAWGSLHLCLNCGGSSGTARLIHVRESERT